MEGRLRIMLAIPAYWPAHAFGGPVVVARELVSRLVARGHEVEVVTTTLRDVGERASARTVVATVDGARVTYLGTPLRYRWMGITPTLPLVIRRLAKPNVVSVEVDPTPTNEERAALIRVSANRYAVGVAEEHRINGNVEHVAIRLLTKPMREIDARTALYLLQRGRWDEVNRACLKGTRESRASHA